MTTEPRPIQGSHKFADPYPGFNGIHQFGSGNQSKIVFLKINLALDETPRSKLIKYRDNLLAALDKLIQERLRNHDLGPKTSATVPARRNFYQRLFHLTPYHNDAATLLNLIMQGDYKKIFRMIDQHPEAMFQPISQKNGRSTTAFEHAFQNFDTLTWNYALRKFNFDPALFYKFDEQKHEQKKQGFWDLRSLADVYAEYNKKFGISRMRV